MSEDSIPPAKKTRRASTVPAAKAAKVAKTAKSAPVKAAKKAVKKAAVSAAPQEAMPQAPPAPIATAAPARAPREGQRREESRRPEPREESRERGERSSWPEPETIQGGEGAPSGGKRKRRRKKKGAGQNPNFPQSQGQPQGHQNPQTASDALPVGRVMHPAVHLPSETSSPVAQPQSQKASQTQKPSPPQQQGPRIQLDAEDLSNKAWKIFLAEVSEEGLALIDDQDARELSRRSFKMAEIFLEEQARRVR